VQTTWQPDSMRFVASLVFIICISASGNCCRVDIIQPTHLAATVSLEFSIAVAQPSDLAATIDGSVIFKDTISGNITFALQAR
jgi:hypothetical protein